MHEIITLQFGHYSNFVGTHFWNTQVLTEQGKKIGPFALDTLSRVARSRRLATDPNFHIYSRKHISTTSN